MSIVLVFVGLSLLILWFIIGSKGSWWIKAAVITLTVHLCLSIGMSLPDFAGWPSKASIPPKFVVHWLVVQEPDKHRNVEGLIYMWATALPTDNTASLSNNVKSGWRRLFISLVSTDKIIPRAYEMPYSKGSHEAANDVLTRIKKGQTVIGTSDKAKGGSGGDNKQGKTKEGSGHIGDKKGTGESKGGFSLSDDVIFQDLPKPILPDKD